MKPKPGYVQTKIKFCTTPPFTGLGALGMWYGHALESEITKWETDSITARIGATTEKVALCTRHDGYQLRRIQTDGTLLRVYESNTNQLLEDTVLPVAVLGDYIEILDPQDVPTRLTSKGGFLCEFAVDGITYTGYVLQGKQYSAAWTDDGRALHFEEAGAKKPNAHVIRKLEPQRLTV